MAIYEGFAPTYRQAWFYDVSKEEEESHAAYKKSRERAARNKWLLGEIPYSIWENFVIKGPVVRFCNPRYKFEPPSSFILLYLKIE